MNYRRNEDRLCRGTDYRILDNYVLSITTVIPVDVADEPLSLTDAKVHLKVDYSDEDTYITDTITEAREQVEDEVGMALAPRTLKVEILNEKGNISLPYGPVSTIVGVTDHAGDAVDANDYEIENGVLKTAFDDVVFVEYETGYAAGECPKKYVRMIKERLAFLFKNRGDEKKTNNNGVWLA